MRRRQPSLLCLALLSAVATGAAAGESPGTLTLIFENDSPFSDRNYTNGLVLSFVSGNRSEPGLTRWLGRHLLFAEQSDRIRFGVHAGQSLFTPDDTTAAGPLPDQHPYAGWLYGGLSLVVESETTLDTLALELGTVGPNALGERTQTLAHNILGVSEPGGWDNQVRNEIAGALYYDRKWRLGIERAGVEFDVSPDVGFALGTRLTQANFGVTLRMGDDLRNDFGPLRNRPGLPGSGLLQRSDRFSGYVYLGAQARAVAYDISIDGNTRSGGPRAGRRPLVGDVQAGFALQVLRVQGGVALVVRTPEFRPQNELDLFTTIFLSLQL